MYSNPSRAAQSDPGRRRRRLQILWRAPTYSKLLLKTLATPALLYLTLLGNLVLFAGAFLFYQLEAPVNPNVNHFFDALYWAMCTITTVGYGDIVPQTTAGRALSLALMVLGVTIFLSYTALLVTAWNRRLEREISASERLTHQEYARLIQDMQRLSEQVDRLSAAVDRLEQNGAAADAPDDAPSTSRAAE